MAEDGDVEVDIRTRIGKASSAFQRLQPVWICGAISKKIKLQFVIVCLVWGILSCIAVKIQAQATSEMSRDLFGLYRLISE